MTHDQADWGLLGLANEKGRFAIEVTHLPSPDVQMAFDRGIDRDWFALVDVSLAVATSPCRLMRVFKLTARGWERHAELKAAFPD